MDSNPVHKEAIQRFCNQYNIEVSESFLRNRVYGKKNSDWIPELFGALSSEQLARLSQEKEEIFREQFDPQAHRVNGLLRLIRNLNQHEVEMAVATSAPAVNSKYILEHLSIRDKFEAVLHTSDVERGKPAPDIYEKAASRLHLNPSRCIVFEDSPTGAEAAIKAGCLTVGLMTTYKDGELAHCFRTIDDFTEIDCTTLESWMRKFEDHSA